VGKHSVGDGFGLLPKGHVRQDLQHPRSASHVNSRSPLIEQAGLEQAFVRRHSFEREARLLVIRRAYQRFRSSGRGRFGDLKPSAAFDP